jgi:hypothetical protein
VFVLNLDGIGGSDLARTEMGVSVIKILHAEPWPLSTSSAMVLEDHRRSLHKLGIVVFVIDRLNDISVRSSHVLELDWRRHPAV